MTNSADAARQIADQAADRVGPTLAVAVKLAQQDELIAALRHDIRALRETRKVQAEIIVELRAKVDGVTDQLQWLQPSTDPGVRILAERLRRILS